MIKIWLDDIRTPPAPEEYYWCTSVNDTKYYIQECEKRGTKITELDLDHDLGDYAKDGGDAIKLILWLIETERFYPIKLHTMNPVGRENMQALIDRYWPK